MRTIITSTIITVGLLGQAYALDVNGTVQDLTRKAPSVNASTSLSAAIAPSTTMALTPVNVNGATYVTGGVGEAERNQLEATKGDYNLHIMSAGKDGAFVADGQIAISDKKGNEVINTKSGPLFYAQLPDGSYTVNASYEGQTKTQRITVGKGKPANLHLSWK
ncbi:hypothetical protein GC177_08750 [bacterium]|nr:hypothetical protein [bacterium]